MEQFIQNFYTFKYSRNLAVDTSDSGDKEEDDNQISFLNQKTRKMRRIKNSIRQNRFRNQQGDTCSYYNRLIKSTFIVLFSK